MGGWLATGSPRKGPMGLVSLAVSRIVQGRRYVRGALVSAESAKMKCRAFAPVGLFFGWAILAVGVVLLGINPASAAYPERNITLIVPFAPGGPTDIIARILSAAFQKSLGQSVIVDNRGGAAGNI